MSELSRIKLARAFSKEARALYGDQIEEIILYGSVARGEDGKDSDIDLFVLTKTNGTKLQYELSDIAYDIGHDNLEMLAVHVYSKKDLDRKKDFTFFRNVEDDGIRI